MAKLEDLLKAQGFTDAEITANAALLNDPKLRGSLEASYSKLEEDLTKYKTENANWASWHETDGKPTLAKFEKGYTDALAESASLKERLRLAEEAGFAPSSSHKEPEPAKTAAGEPFDYKKHNLVTMDDVSKLAEAEAQAIAMSTNIAEEYRYLTGGKSIFDYSYNTPDGRNLRGMIALRQEARDTGFKQSLDKFAETKFDFGAKRQAIADAQKKAAEDAIRADERSKLMKETGDPNLRTWMPSRNPFMPRPEGSEAKQPWEGDQTASQRRSARLERAMETQMKGAVN